QNDNSGHSNSTNDERNLQVDLTGRSPDALQAPVTNVQTRSGTVNINNNINNSPNITFHQHVYNLPSSSTQNGQHSANHPRVAVGERENSGPDGRSPISGGSREAHDGAEPSDELSDNNSR
ncbi:hypothetical protein V5O48_013558, partial [Marasmius crinis-equi]